MISLKVSTTDSRLVEDIMVDASTFHRSIQKIWNYSQQFNDGWMLHDNSVLEMIRLTNYIFLNISFQNEENAYISKKLKIQIASCILNFEYHVIYNLSYSVPVLFFNIYKSGINHRFFKFVYILRKFSRWFSYNQYRRLSTPAQL